MYSNRDACPWNAAKLLGENNAKQRYGRLFKRTDWGIEGKGCSIKSIVYFDEVATSNAFSACSIRRYSTAAGGYAEA